MFQSGKFARKKRGIAVACLLTLISAPLVTSSPAAGSADPTFGIPDSYEDYQVFPACSPSRKTFCVESWGIDFPNSGSFLTPSDQSISFNAWLFSIKDWNTPSMAYELRVNGLQELNPVIPVGTAFQFSINTGAFQPAPSLFTQAEVISFDIQNIEGNWITSGTFSTTSLAFALGCDASANCANPTNQTDYVSVAQGVQFYEEPNPLRESKKGMWVSTNAAVTGELQFDRQTMTWSVDLSGPARKADGTRNVLRYSTFLPDSFVQVAYGTTADVIARTLVMTRTDFDETTILPATITRVQTPQSGVLISMPSIELSGNSSVANVVRTFAGSRFSTAPKLKIKPKNSLLSAPKIRRVARVSKNRASVVSLPVRGAKKYQAMCTRGATTVFATSRSTNIRLSGITKGKWRCSVRGIGTLGGKWSKRVVLK